MKSSEEIKAYIKKTFPNYHPTPDKDARLIACKIEELMRKEKGN